MMYVLAMYLIKYFQLSSYFTCPHNLIRAYSHLQHTAVNSYSVNRSIIFFLVDHHPSTCWLRISPEHWHNSNTQSQGRCMPCSYWTSSSYPWWTVACTHRSWPSVAHPWSSCPLVILCAYSSLAQPSCPLRTLQRFSASAFSRLFLVFLLESWLFSGFQPVSLMPGMDSNGISLNLSRKQERPEWTCLICSCFLSPNFFRISFCFLTTPVTSK